MSCPVAGSGWPWPLMKSMPLALTACEYGPAAGGPPSTVTVSREWDMGGTYTSHAEPPCLRDLAVPAATQGQPRGLVSVGFGGVCSRPRRRQARARLDRLRGVPLVPRHGARIVRERGGRRADELLVRLHQGGPRGAPGRRRDLHGRRAGDDRPGRLAAERVPDARGRAVLGG